MRVLVCGDRFWSFTGVMFEALDEIHDATPISVVIEGEAQGADKMSKQWGWSRMVPVDKYPADWDRFHKAAGPIRNRQMLKEGRPDLVVAFHDKIEESKGTIDMIKIALKAGVQVRLFTARGERDLTTVPGL